MKKSYFLSLFLTIPALGFAQQKHEIGFVVTAGIYTLPSQKTDYTDNVAGSRNTFQQEAGETYSLGLWYARRMGNYIRISGELLYRRATVGSQEGHYSEYYDGGFIQQYVYKQSQQITENSLSLPIKIHLSFRKNGKTTLAFGAGIARLFSAERNGQTESRFGATPMANYTFPRIPTNWEDFNMEKTLTAGIFHRLDANTSIGLEYTFEQSSARQYTTFLPNIGIVDCFCYGYYLAPPANMNSFSISLRHNILKNPASLKK
jgi:hypothetical protein